MEEQASPNWVVIDRNGNAFLAVDYLDNIPTFPPDDPVRERFFNETVEVAIPGPSSVCAGPQLFVSLNTLNMLLASAPTKPLHASIVTEVTKDGYNRIALRLEDSDGNEVPFVDQVRDGLGDLRALIKEEEEAGEGQLETDAPEPPGDNRECRHGTPSENDAGRVEDRQVQQQDEPEDDATSHEDQAPPDSTPGAEGSDGGTTTAPPRPQDGDVLDATPLRPRDYRVADDNVNNPGGAPPRQHRDGGPYDRALVKQLRDLRLTDNATLSALLHDRLPPALDRFRHVQDDLVHLATLSSGQVCSVRIFRDLYARREDLSFPSLADPSLLHRPVTAYQKLELLKVLRDASPTAGGRPGGDDDAAAWPPPSHPASLPSMRQGLLDRSYQTVAQFERALELLATYPGGGGRRGAAARRRAVDDIRAMMRARCAIGPWDVLDPLFNGLLREVVVPAVADPAAAVPRPPRFVLPLGRLYRAEAGRADARPRPLDCFVLLDVESPRKPLWLLRRSGEGCCDLVALAEDIGLWRLGGRDDNRDGGLVRRGGPAGAGGGERPSEGETALLRAKLMKEYPESLVQLGPHAVRFRRVDKQRAAEAIRKGWGVAAAATAASGPGSPAGSPPSSSSSSSSSPSPSPRRTPRARAQAEGDSPLRRALLNSAAARARAQVQVSPTKKRGRDEAEEEQEREGGAGKRDCGDDDEDDGGSDEEWTPTSERRSPKKTSRGRRNPASRRGC